MMWGWGKGSRPVIRTQGVLPETDSREGRGRQFGLPHPTPATREYIIWVDPSYTPEIPARSLTVTQADLDELWREEVSFRRIDHWFHVNGLNRNGRPRRFSYSTLSPEERLNRMLAALPQPPGPRRQR